MSKSQIRLCLVLLLMVNMALPALLAPFGLAVGTNVNAIRVGYSTMGAMMAAPAMLAFWAALAPQPLLSRAALALVMFACVGLSHDFAMVQNSGSRREPAEMLQILALLTAMVVCLLPLWLLRARFGWTIVPPVSTEMVGRRDGNQFSMRGLLLGTVVIAALFAALRWLHPGNLAVDSVRMHLLRFGGFGLFMGLLGFPALVVGWLVLSRGGRSRLRRFTSVLGACAIAAAAIAVALAPSPGDFKELVFLLLGVLLCAVPNFWIARLCGYRLVRLGRDDNLAQQLLAPDPSPRRRFAIAVCSMLLMLAAIATALPSRIELWREKSKERDWSDLGFLASFAKGQVTYLSRLDDARPAIDAAVIDRISACDRLQHLSLGPSETDDETLVLLGSLPELASLSLFGTRVSDEGLRQLVGKVPNLADLSLQAADIGDDGLLALTRLKRLAVLDISHTRVTPRGIARLKAARPNLRLTTTTDDSTLGNVASMLRPRRTVLSRPAGWRPVAVRLHAAGPAVTDVGIVALRGMTNIQELDLANADVTDASVAHLATLSGLKKLTLAGTKITASGIARLRQALPSCAIEP